MSLFFHYLSLPYLLQGIWFTLAVTGLGLAGGLILGLILAGMQLSRFKVLSIFARAYTVIFRGTPLILQMVFAYDALPHIGITLSAIGAAGLALAANEAPFIAEMLRAGVLGVDRGQIAAGQALGMTPGMLILRIIAPQALRDMVPAIGNETVSALKNSSLASVISVQELTLRSTQLASSTFDFFSIFFASGLIYLGLTTTVSIIQLLAERALDLDRAKRPPIWRNFLPWRVDETTVPPPPGTSAGALNGNALRQPSAPAAPLPHAALIAERAKRAATLDSNDIAVEVKDLRKSYANQAVLDGLDLTVKFGEVVALLGPSGSGKSTLLRCINHLESSESGIVRVAGRRLDVSETGRPLSPREIANERASVGVGMVFQQFNLFAHLTALENIGGPLRWIHSMSRPDAERRARALLDRVGLSHRSDALPRHMSGGQQQRVAIARALAPYPSVLLLDEPTSALDPELVSEVLDVIRKLAVEDGLTMIIATHQIRFADEVADRVAFLNGGSIIEQGPAHEVLTSPKHPLTQRFLSIMEADKAPQRLA